MAIYVKWAGEPVKIVGLIDNYRVVVRFQDDSHNRPSFHYVIEDLWADGGTQEIGAAIEKATTPQKDINGFQEAQSDFFRAMVKKVVTNLRKGFRARDGNEGSTEPK